MHKPKQTSPETSARAGRPWARARTASTILTLWIALSGCAPVRVLDQDQVLIHLRPGQSITATNGGYLMSESLYLRYRRAVSAQIEQSSKP